MTPAPALTGVGKRPTPHAVATVEPGPTAADPGRLLNPLRVRHGCSRCKRAVSGKKPRCTSASEADRQQNSSDGFSPSRNQRSCGVNTWAAGVVPGVIGVREPETEFHIFVNNARATLHYTSRLIQPKWVVAAGGTCREHRPHGSRRRVPPHHENGRGFQWVARLVSGTSDRD
jgi:hypothetical protein